MTFVLSYLITLLILNFVIFFGDENKVEAKKKEVIPVPGWFNDVEGFVLPNIKKSTRPSYIGKHIETDEMLLNALNKKQKNNKVKKERKKGAKKFIEEKRKKFDRKKKKKHRFGGNRLKFLKTDVIDAKDSKLSNSQEKVAERKPVDIIVHIKMNE